MKNNKNTIDENNKNNNEDVVMPFDENKKSKKEKTLIFVIFFTIILALVAAGYSVARMNDDSWLSFKANDKQDECLDGNCVDDDMADYLSSQSKDTDGDGLTDYEEIYIYGTSPYLKDSDGDGMDDKYEVEMGYDPNCKGKECSNVAPNNNDLDDQQTANNDTSVSADADISFLEDLSADQIRELLLDQGVPQELLSQFSDEELYQMMLEELQSVN